jgi:NurA-like 5'-3' nuclease
MKSCDRRVEVAEYLVDHFNEWVDGSEVSNERVGGSEGLRRLRELRSKEYGWIVERRKKPGSTQFQYKLIGFA